jgi:hypothetical protein
LVGNLGAMKARSNHQEGQGQILDKDLQVLYPFPKSVTKALQVDEETGTNFWAKVIAKEMKTIDHAFEFHDDDKMPVGYQKINCHVVFDVKIMLEHKAWYVAGGHQTEPTKDMTFVVSIVLRDSIWIAFLVAALNDLEILSADVARAYLNARAKEKVYTKLATHELDAKHGQYYQSLIGVLCWICELGRLNILVAVLMLSRYVVSPREGHLQQVFHIFAYMKHHKRLCMVFDDMEPVFDESLFKVCDWSADFYPNAEEAIPHDALMVWGNGIIMSCFMDVDHAGCKAMRHLHTGVILFVNKAPIIWYSKLQNTVETSTFGS